MNQKMSSRAWNVLVDSVLVAEEEFTAIEDWQDERYKPAKEKLAAARSALSTAMDMACWGANGSCFITRRQTRIASGRYYVELWINRRLRAIREDGGRVDVFTLAQAEEQYKAKKQLAREQGKKYAPVLEEVARLLCAAGIKEIDWWLSDWQIGGWTYQGGQCGGYFHKTGALSVSAPGALRRAAIYASEEDVLRWCDRPEVHMADAKYYGDRY